MSYESPHDLERSVGYETSQLSSVGLMSPSRLAEVQAQLRSTRRIKRLLAAPIAGILSVGALGAIHKLSEAPVKSYTAVELATPLIKPPTTITVLPTTLKPRAETTTTSTTIKKVSPTTVAATTTTAPSTIRAANAPISVPSLKPIQYDIAWPQCAAAKSNPNPLPPSPESVVQISGGQPDERSPCLMAEATHEGAATEFYFMAGARGPNAFQYLYGYMERAIQSLEANSLSGGVFLDVEMGQNDRGEELWTADQVANFQAIEGAIQALNEAAQATNNRIRFAGIYSNKKFMQEIVGDRRLNVPMWYTTGQSNQKDALSYCGRPDLAFANGPWALVQYQPTPQIDMDVACPGAA